MKLLSDEEIENPPGNRTGFESAIEMAGEEEEWMWLFREFCLPKPEVPVDEFESEEGGLEGADEMDVGLED